MNSGAHPRKPGAKLSRLGKPSTSIMCPSPSLACSNIMKANRIEKCVSTPKQIRSKRTKAGQQLCVLSEEFHRLHSAQHDVDEIPLWSHGCGIGVEQQQRSDGPRRYWRPTLIHPGIEAEQHRGPAPGIAAGSQCAYVHA